MKILTITLLLILLLGCEKKPCNQIVTAFDIGSATTKMVVARVNQCEHKITKILLESQLKVNYKESLKKSPFFSQEIIKDGKRALDKLTELATPFAPQASYAVATEAFRNATNGKQAAIEISKHLIIKILTQEKEARLGYLAAKANAKTQNVLAWDIGGGSMQISDGKTIYQGKVASVTFKNQIIKDIQKSSKNTPNPMSTREREEAILLAMNVASRDVPPILKKKAKSYEVIGIGSVHHYSIQKQTKSKEYGQTVLLETINKLSGKNDIELGGEYASTDISNLCLVYGFMKSLNINKVRVVKVNLAHGLLLEHSINSLAIK